MILEKVKTYIDENRLLTPGNKVIVGVSGGIDSVALLHLLQRLGVECIVAHCNFHLRAEESDRDEQFVKDVTKQLGLPFYRIDFDTLKYAANNKISVEMAARELRYEWFESLAKKLDAQAIAVAHHLDDSIETLLMNLIRGTGLRGLTGISARNGLVIRPLLCCTREELFQYVTFHQLAYVEDSTNALNDYQRNKIRNQLLPLLEDINPSVRQTLYQSLERFSGTYKVYEEFIDSYKKLLMKDENGTIIIDISLILKLPDVTTVLYEFLSPYGFNAQVVQQVVSHLNDTSGKKFYSSTYRLVKDRQNLILTKRTRDEKKSIQIDEGRDIITYPLPLSIHYSDVNNVEINKNKNVLTIDAELVKFPLILRKWEEGDVFVPFGMKGMKKLSDFFIDNKFSLPDKENTWLLVSDEKIVWIVGHRADNRFRVTAETRKIIIIELTD